MEITRSSLTISEVRDMWQRRELIVNKNYQRSSSVWPESARTYFIDTILNRYIFPKVYFYQVFDKARKKVIREIVDGQQRLTTILCFLNDEFSLSNRSVKYQGKRFSDLDDDTQQQFLTYSVEVDIIYSAEQADLLAMFTRMNAYTAPLNPAEKRHAEFEGPFKWFIIEATGEIGPRLVQFNVLTSKQAIRMHDAEFITELAIVLEHGIVNKSESSLNHIYKQYNKIFPCEQEFRERIYEFMQLLEQDFSPLKNTYITKSYVCHSLFCALMQKKYGIPGGDVLGAPPVGVFFTNLQRTIDELSALAGAHELQDITGPYHEYVEACMSTTHRVKQRTIRSQWLIKALI
jgi:hypothetical protein